MRNTAASRQSLLSEVRPSKAIVSLAVPAMLALLAKAVYNIVDTAYIGMLGSDIALAAVGVTLPILLIMVSIENIFAAGAAVLAGRQLGAALNVILDPVFMFSWGFDMGVEGASLATTVSQCATFLIIMGFYISGRSIIKIKPRYFKLSGSFLWAVVSIGIPTAVIQICLAAATSLTNIAAKPLPDSDLIIAAYAFGAKNEDRFHDCVRFALKGALLLTVLVAGVYILLSAPLISLFNRNPLVVEFGKWLLISQVALYPAFGLCYMMTITFQTIGSSKMGLFLSMIRQGLFYVPFILSLPKIMGITGLYLCQPAADVLTILVCLFLIKPMKRLASENMNRQQ